MLYGDGQRLLELERVFNVVYFNPTLVWTGEQKLARSFN